jgi:tetratricopeptide (TPR) repeat protein
MPPVSEQASGASFTSEAQETSEVVQRFRQVLRGDPDNVEAHYGLGNALMVQGRFAEAVASYEQVLRLRPQQAEAHNNLGVALAEQGRLAEAVVHYELALQEQPAYAEAHYNWANALKVQEQYRGAAEHYHQAVRLRPTWAAAHNNLGLVSARLGEFEQARSCYEQALRLLPTYAEAHNNLALLLQTQGQLDLALIHFNRAIELQPEFAAAHANRAQVWLLLGHYRRGWPEYEWRSKIPGAILANLPQPVWDGTDLTGRTILLRAEQGIGDTIQFIRYAPLVKQKGGRVLVEAPDTLLPLLRCCSGIDELIARGSPLPDFEVQARLPSLPGILQTTLADIPAPIPYLTVDVAMVGQWKKQLGAVRTFKIGISWKGISKYPGDRERSIALRHFMPLARIPGVRVFSLQKGPGMAQLAELEQPDLITDLGSRLDETAGAFMDTAAVMKNLKLVITSDTATAHLAGALGVPVWIALSVACDWRWMIDRLDSPWYPTMRLFRQTTLDRWDDVFERMATALQGMVPAPKPRAPRAPRKKKTV